MIVFWLHRVYIWPNINVDDCKLVYHTKACLKITQHRPAYVWCTNMSSCLCACACFICLLADAMKYSVWDRGVNSTSTDRPFCCGVIQLWLQGMANGCRPCSMFSIGSIQHLSTHRCILIYPAVPLSLPVVEQSTRVHLGLLQAIVIFLGSVKATLRTEQHEQRGSRRQTIRQENRPWILTHAYHDQNIYLPNWSAFKI